MDTFEQKESYNFTVISTAYCWTLVSSIGKTNTAITSSSAVTEIYVSHSLPSVQPSTTRLNFSVANTTDAVTITANEEQVESTSASNHTTAADSAEMEATLSNKAVGMISAVKVENLVWKNT